MIIKYSMRACLTLFATTGNITWEIFKLLYTRYMYHHTTTKIYQRSKRKKIGKFCPLAPLVQIFNLLENITTKIL